MKRTTIFVPEALERDLQLRAKGEGRPAASLIREALAEYLARRASAVLPSFVGAFASGRSDTAERHEELLFADADPHGGESAPARRRRDATTRPRRTRRRSVTRPTGRTRR